MEADLSEVGSDLDRDHGKMMKRALITSCQRGTGAASGLNPGLIRAEEESKVEAIGASS